MSAFSPDFFLAKLGPIPLQTLSGAFSFARTRGDADVEPIHWLHLWMQSDQADVPLILERLLPGKCEMVFKDIEHGLENLPKLRASRLYFSSDLELSIERGWVSASLSFGATHIRTGHILHGMLEHSRLRKLLQDISPLFRELGSETLSTRWSELTNGSVEDGEALSTPAPPATTEGGAEAGAGLVGQGALALYSMDLTAEAAAERIDPVEGRDREIREVIDILMRRRQNNPVIVGEAGVGKTALVEGLAQRIQAGDVPPALQGTRLVSLDLAAMQAGASVRGEFENRLKKVIAEIQSSPVPIVLFIDEAHTLIGAGGSAGTGDAANLLKPALARGTLRTIAATTWAEYKKHIEKDAALTRRFQVVQVGEPSVPLATEMLRGMSATLQQHHNVLLLDEAVTAAVTLTARYLPGRQLPDKAVSVLDTACARVALSQGAVPPAIEDTKRRIVQLERAAQSAERERRLGVRAQERQVTTAAELEEVRNELAALEGRYERERSLATKLIALQNQAASGDGTDVAERDGREMELQRLRIELGTLQGEAPLIYPAVDREAVASVVESWTGIPVGRMQAAEIEDALELEVRLRGRVVGQDGALRQLAQRLCTVRAGLHDERKPLGVFLLIGPSGVGKTETALALAEQLFGTEESCITINMSEFQEAHTVSTLKGAPPGYVGYGEGGRLTEAVRRRPYCVLLLDEIEKAHPDVHKIFFQVFDKGAMEDGEGRRIDFKNTVILATSNAGSELITKLCADPELTPSFEGMTEAVRAPLLKVFPDALVNRMTVVPYYPLSAGMLDSIIRLQLERVAQRVRDSQGVPFTYDEAVVELIRRRCTQLESGARLVDSVLQNSVLPNISREILERIRVGRPPRQVHVASAGNELAYSFGE